MTFERLRNAILFAVVPPSTVSVGGFLMSASAFESVRELVPQAAALWLLALPPCLLFAIAALFRGVRLRSLLFALGGATIAELCFLGIVFASAGSDVPGASTTAVAICALPLIGFVFGGIGFVLGEVVELIRPHELDDERGAA